MKQEVVKPKKVISGSPDPIRQTERVLGGIGPGTPKVKDLLTAEEAEQVEAEMLEFAELSEMKKRAEKRMEELKQRFLTVAIANRIEGDTGFESDTAVFTYREQSRSSLSEELLLKHIPADVLAECKVQNKFFVTTVRTKR